jgi:hypothetical protein
MSDPCDKGPEIQLLREAQTEQGLHIKQILEHQVQASLDMKESLDKMTKLIMEGNTTRLEVEQGKKERALLFTMVRNAEEHLATIDVRNARCDGAGIFDQWPSVLRFVNQQKGIQRFIPYVLTIMTGLMTLFNVMVKA